MLTVKIWVASCSLASGSCKSTNKRAKSSWIDTYLHIITKKFYKKKCHEHWQTSTSGLGTSARALHSLGILLLLLLEYLCLHNSETHLQTCDSNICANQSCKNIKIPCHSHYKMDAQIQTCTKNHPKQDKARVHSKQNPHKNSQHAPKETMKSVH